MINIGVIGYGYWGPNIVRNFSSLDGTRVLPYATATRRPWTGRASPIRMSR